MSLAMTEERHSEVLGGLPRTRPHRRSDKRDSARTAPPTPETTDGPAPPTADTPGGPAVPATAPRTATTKTKPGATNAKAAAAKTKTAARTESSPKAKSAAAKPKTAAAKPTADRPTGGGARLRQPEQPDGTPARGPAKPYSPARHSPRDQPAPKGTEILGTAVQAAAELAEIGLSAGARALRRAVSRLPRP